MTQVDLIAGERFTGPVDGHPTPHEQGTAAEPVFHVLPPALQPEVETEHEARRSFLRQDLTSSSARLQDRTARRNRVAGAPHELDDDSGAVRVREGAGDVLDDELSRATHDRRSVSPRAGVQRDSTSALQHAVELP